MKNRIGIVILLSAATAMAQVASHAPTINGPAMNAPAFGATTPGQPPAPTGSVSSFNVSGKTVAKVNGAVLTDRDLLREMMTIFPYAQTHGGFPKEMEHSIRDGALKMIEFEELLYQEGERRKMVVPAARIDKAVTRFRHQFQTDEDFDKYIKTDMNGSMEQFRQSVRRSLLIESLLKSELDVPSHVTLAEARAYYDKHPGPFTEPAKIQFQSISVMPSEKATADVKEQARKQANELWQQAKATKSYEEFGLLAEKSSQDDFRVDMGNHKLTPRGSIPPDVLKILDPLKVGQVSSLCQFGPYYTILRLEARKPAGKKPFEQVSAKLREDMQKDRYETMRRELEKKLRANAQVEEL